MEKIRKLNAFNWDENDKKLISSWGVLDDTTYKGMIDSLSVINNLHIRNSDLSYKLLIFQIITFTGMFLIYRFIPELKLIATIYMFIDIVFILIETVSIIKRNSMLKDVNIYVISIAIKAISKYYLAKDISSIDNIDMCDNDITVLHIILKKYRDNIDTDTYNLVSRALILIRFQITMYKLTEKKV